MRLLVLTPYKIFPADTGGTAYAYGLCRAYAAQTDRFALHSVVTVKDATSWPDAPFPYRATRAWMSVLSVTERLKIFPKIPYFHAMQGLARRIAARIVDVGPDVVEVHHPWLMRIREHLPDSMRVVLAAHNVEAVWYERMIRRGAFSGALERRLHAMEAEALDLADLVSCLSERDREAFARLYHVPWDRMFVCPPGYDPDRLSSNGHGAGDGQKIRALFLGSNYTSNFEAATQLVDRVAPTLPGNIELLVAGNVCASLRRRRLPSCVKLLGYVPDPVPLFHACDILVNPSLSETGVHIKNIEALACGLRVVTTPEGVHGFEPLRGDMIHVAAIEDFSAPIRDAKPLNEAEMERVRAYAWPEMARKRLDQYQAVGQQK